MIGGPGVAYNINNDRRQFPTSQRPNGGDMMVGAAEAGLPVDFFTFHDVNPCLYLPKCNVTDVSSSPLRSRLKLQHLLVTLTVSVASLPGIIM